jgi:carbamoylphosphate synthase small subunit
MRAIEAMEQMFGDPTYKGQFVYEAVPTFDADGVRTYDELASGDIHETIMSAS